MSEEFKIEDRFFNRYDRILKRMRIDFMNKYPVRGKLLLVALDQVDRELNAMRGEKISGKLKEENEAM